MDNRSDSLDLEADEPVFVETSFKLTGVPVPLDPAAPALVKDAPAGAPEPCGVQVADDKRFDCLVVGVGGQGAVLASRLIAAACMNRDLFVRTAETIGMSQRGGSVASHVRVAATARDLPSSMIPDHGADLVLAFEPGEAVRAWRYLAPSGALVCSSRPVVPSAAASSGYTGEAQVAWLRSQLGSDRLAVVDAGVLEGAGLSPKCLNVLLLGAAIGLGALPFGADELRAAMGELMKPRLIPMNEQALELGMGLA